MKVFVYFNLHRKLFSIRAMQGPMKGRVIGHSSEVVLKDVTFKVSEAGRQRVIREQKKNVHAGCVGTLSSFADAPIFEDGKAITYNPYKFEQFVTLEGHQPVRTATFAVLMNKRINAWETK